jgi:hypothetical protein
MAIISGWNSWRDSHGQPSDLPKNRPPAFPKPPVKIVGNVKITDPALVKKVFAAL